MPIDFNIFSSEVAQPIQIHLGGKIAESMKTWRPNGRLASDLAIPPNVKHLLNYCSPGELERTDRASLVWGFRAISAHHSASP
jgi:hypothetical protein